MRNIEIILKLLVPILFLIVWALNQVLAKDAKQAAGQFGKKPAIPPQPPPQPGRRPDWAGPGQMERRLGPNAGRDEVMNLPGEPRARQPIAPSSGPVTARTIPPAPNPFDTMVDRAGGASTANRARKNRRAVATAAPKPTPPATPRLGPENRPGAPSSSTPTGGMSQATAAGGAALAVGAALARPSRSNDALVALKAALASPRDVRQALILAEVLQPPVSMRRRGGR
jgi:hypothetical protein